MTLGIYSVATDISVCPGVLGYQDIPGGKGGRCVRVTTLPPSCAECLAIWSLNRPEPSGPHTAVIGIALPFFYKQWFACKMVCMSVVERVLQFKKPSSVGKPNRQRSGFIPIRLNQRRNVGTIVLKWLVTKGENLKYRPPTV